MAARIITMEDADADLLEGLVKAMRNVRGGGGVSVRFVPGVGLAITGPGKGPRPTARSAGGSILQPMIVTAVESSYDFGGFGQPDKRGDYIRCKNWDGSQAVGPEKWVRMPHELRMTPWHNETVGDLEYDYAADGNAFGVRDVTNVNTSETERQWITPPYVPNTSIIHAIASGEGVADPDSSDPAEPTDLIDANLGARAWSGG